MPSIPIPPHPRLESYAQAIFSYHERAAQDPEAVPHGFLLGLCAVLEEGHRVLSNRESGKGRPDVLWLLSTSAFCS